MSSKHSRNVASFKDVVADGTRQAAVVARRAELESHTPVGYWLTPAADAALTAPGDNPAGPRS